MNKLFHSFLVVLIFLISGCSSPRFQREVADRPIGSGYKPVNVYSVDQLDPSIRRVVVLPFSFEPSIENLQPEIEDAIAVALQRQQRFQLVRVGERDLFAYTGQRSYSFVEPISAEALDWLMKTYSADAVLQVHITAYRPYKPLMIGLQSRLFDISSNRILWSCDEVFDAGNKKVLTAARIYAEKEIQQPYPLQSSYSTVMSPQRFAAYVGQAIFETLPPFAVQN